MGSSKIQFLLGAAVPLALFCCLFSPAPIAVSLALISLALICRLAPSGKPLSVSLPWPWIAFAALPLLQVLPLGLYSGVVPAPVSDELTRFGAVLPPTWSFQPEATLRSAALAISAMAAFLICRHIAGRRQALWTLVIGLLLLALWQSVEGLSQYFAGMWLSEKGQVAHGRFINRGYYAAFLSGTLWLALGVAVNQYKQAASSAKSLAVVLAAAVTVFCSAAAITASLSRTAFLVNAFLGLAAVFVLPLSLRKKAAVTFALICAAATVVLSGLLRPLLSRFNEADPGRLLIWHDALASARDTPLGAGAGTFVRAFQRSEPYFLRKTVESAHSDYFEWALEFGPVVGLLFAAALLVAVARLFLRSPNNVENRWLLLGITFSAAALALHAVTDSILHTAAAAILLASLLGLGWGLTRPVSQQRQRLGTALLSAGLCCCTLLLGGALRPLELETAFAQARRMHLQGDEAGARQGYVAALEASPLAAPAWLGLAELARAQGDAAQALRLTKIARLIEPFTYRTEWALADLELASGDVRSGVETLRLVCLELPDLRPAAYLLAWRAGAPLDLIEHRLTAPDPYAVGEYLAFLIRTNNIHEVSGAYQRLVETQQIVLSDAHRRYLADHN